MTVWSETINGTTTSRYPIHIHVNPYLQSLSKDKSSVTRKLYAVTPLSHTYPYHPYLQLLSASRQQQRAMDSNGKARVS